MKWKREYLWFLLALVVAGPGVRGQVDDFQPGLNLDVVAEKRIAEATAEILDVLARKSENYERVIEKLVGARREAENLLAKVQTEPPEFVFEPKIPAKAPILVFGSIRPQEIRLFWVKQLDLRVRAVHAVLTHGPGFFQKWNQVIGVGWRHRGDLTKRALPVVEALREAHKDALLLQRPAEIIRVERSQPLFKDTLTREGGEWHMYGPAWTSFSDQGMRRRNKAILHADTMIWTQQEFGGNFLVEFDFVPHNEGTPGALFAICGRPAVEGTNLSVSCGETMDVYNVGVHAYHFSVHRGNTGLSNGRRVGNGLKLISSRSPDPAAVTGRKYSVTIGKWEDVVFFLVNGKLVHNYYDAATFGTPLTGGSVGMRHWGGLDATYSNVRVHKLVERQR